MLIYLIVIIVLFVMHSNLQTESNVTRRIKLEHSYVRSICTLFIILAALRYVMPGTDADGYMGWYMMMPKITFDEVLEERDLSYIYYLSSKIFSLMGLSYHFWFAFLELLYLSAFIRIINRFSVDNLLCIFLFFTIGLFSFSMNGLKQTLAMCIIWHGFIDSYDKKYVRALIMVAFAYYCHKSSMVFLMAYIMLFIRNLKTIYYAIFVASLSMLVFSHSAVLESLAAYMGDEHYIDYLNDQKGYAATTFIFYLILFGIAYFAKNKKMIYKTEEKDVRIVIGLAAISVFSQIFAFRVATAFRLSLYFTPFLIIYLSNKIRGNKEITLIVFVIASVWLLYTSRSFPYKFFWQ